MHIWYWVFGLTLVFPLVLNLILKWIVAPIRLKGKNAITIAPRREPTVPEKLSAEIQHFLGRMVREFRAEEFETVANSTVPNAVPNVEAVQVLLVNRQRSEVALLITTWAPNTRSLVFAVRSHFSDGTTLVTGANPGIGIYPGNPEQDSANFAWVRDAATLCEAHRRRLHRTGRDSRPRFVPVPGEESKYIEEEHEKSLRWFVRCGYNWLDEKAGLCRKTWKGTFLSTWKLTNPIKRWRIRLRDRKSRRLWEDLGMNSWTAPIDSVDATAPDTRAILPPPLPARTRPIEAATGGAQALQYEPLVDAGGAQYEHANGALAVRVGSLTAADVLLVQLGRVLALGFIGLVIVVTAFTTWRRWQLAQMIPSYRFHGPGIFLYVCVAIFAYDTWKLISALRRSLRAPMAWASREHLRFANAPAGRRSGQIRPDQIESFRISLDQGGIWKKVYRLEARLRGSTASQPLFLSMHRATLEHMKKSLLHALGITADGALNTIAMTRTGT